jgi:cytochrome o ubiquinol oxidase subunit 2
MKNAIVLVSMRRKNKILVGVLLGLGILFISVVYLSKLNIAVLQPAGIVGEKERNLIYVSLLLALVVVVPVFILLFTFIWKYREGNTKAKYEPNFGSSRKLESIWWGIPFAIIFILSIITWKSSHDLDPFKQLNSTAKPLNVQVVALQWKWLFIYPEQNIASVNFMQMPVNTPVNFEITSDAPMNSFWIPQLGGQIYAMSGMSTHLHLMAGKSGDFDGRSANISGKGFSKMTFTARAGSLDSFNDWVGRVKSSNSQLNLSSYATLSKPGEYKHAAYYSSVDKNLYDGVVSKYMAPKTIPTDEHEHGAAL